MNWIRKGLSIRYKTLTITAIFLFVSNSYAFQNSAALRPNLSTDNANGDKFEAKFNKVTEVISSNNAFIIKKKFEEDFEEIFGFLKDGNEMLYQNLHLAFFGNSDSKYVGLIDRALSVYESPATVEIEVNRVLDKIYDFQQNRWQSFLDRFLLREYQKKIMRHQEKLKQEREDKENLVKLELEKENPNSPLIKQIALNLRDILKRRAQIDEENEDEAPDDIEFSNNYVPLELFKLLQYDYIEQLSEARLIALLYRLRYKLPSIISFDSIDSSINRLDFRSSQLLTEKEEKIEEFLEDLFEEVNLRIPEKLDDNLRRRNFCCHALPSENILSAMIEGELLDPDTLKEKEIEFEKGSGEISQEELMDLYRSNEIESKVEEWKASRVIAPTEEMIEGYRLELGEKTSIRHHTPLISPLRGDDGPEGFLKALEDVEEHNQILANKLREAFKDKGEELFGRYDFQKQIDDYYMMRLYPLKGSDGPEGFLKALEDVEKDDPILANKLRKDFEDKGEELFRESDFQKQIDDYYDWAAKEMGIEDSYGVFFKWGWIDPSYTNSGLVQAAILLPIDIISKLDLFPVQRRSVGIVVEETEIDFSGPLLDFSHEIEIQDSIPIGDVVFLIGASGEEKFIDGLKSKIAEERKIAKSNPKVEEEMSRYLKRVIFYNDSLIANIHTAFLYLTETSIGQKTLKNIGIAGRDSKIFSKYSKEKELKPKLSIKGRLSSKVIRIAN